MGWAIKYRTEFKELSGVNWKVDIEYKNLYGFLYNWYAATDARNIAASGSHVPTDTEWATLSTWLVNNGYGYGGSGTDIGKAVASTSGWKLDGAAGAVGNDQASNNASGLNSKPCGWRYKTGVFTTDSNETSQWWSATTRTTSTAWYKFLFYASIYFYRDYYDKKSGFSIRLMADSTTLSDGEIGSYIGNDGKEYPTICIGTQEWLAEDLQETKYRNDDNIPNVTDSSSWAALTTGAYCTYNNETEESNLINLIAAGIPLNFEWNNESDDVFDPIRPSKAIINVKSMTNFTLTELYSVEDMQYRVRIYQNDTLFWMGYIITRDYSEPYEDVPYTVTIKASCGLEVLSDILYDNNGEYYNGRRFYSQMIIDILRKIGYTGFTEYINIYEGAMAHTTSDSPLDQLKIDVDVFRDMYCDEVLKELLKIFNARIKHKDGTFVIYRPVELAETTVYGRIFTATETHSSTNFSTTKYIKRISHSSTLKQVPGGEEMIQSPARKITINQNYGNKDSWLDNYEFKGETFDGTNFKYWTQATGSNVKLITDIISGETDGVFIDSNSSSYEYYLEQIFGSASRYSYTDELVFEFDYLLYNSSGSPQGNVPFYIYIECHTTVYNGSLYEWDENECQFTIPPVVITIQNTSPVGSSGWYHWKRKIAGLNSGYLIIRIFATNNASSHVAIKNIVIKAISGKITRIPKVGFRRDRYSTLSSKWNMAKYTRLETILGKKYNPTTVIRGGIDLDYDYLLGDVTDADIDNVAEQFAGSLATWVSGILAYSTSWLRRPFTATAKPLLELIGDEIRDEYSRPKKLIQMPIRDDSNTVSAIDLIGHYEDDLNQNDGSNRKFIMNREDFDVKNRSWMIDLMEIIDVPQEESESLTIDDTFVTSDDTTVTVDNM